MVGDGERSQKASAWPVVTALGIVAGEVGVLFGLIPLAVAGVLAFGWSSAAMVREAGYARGRWRPLRWIGGAIGGVSVLVWVLQSTALTPTALTVAVRTDPIAVRAAIVLIAGALLVAAGAVGPSVSSAR
jgi:hypothetical protein